MNIQEIRAKYPQYSDMSDGDLASALHKKFYADMPFADFSAKVGLARKELPSEAIGEAQTNPEASVLGMKVQGETSSGLNPAALVIGAGQMADKIKKGYLQANTFKNFAMNRLLGGGQSELDSLMAQKESEAENDRQFKKLETVHPGSTALGQIAAVAPAPVRALPLIAGMEFGDAGDRALKAGAALAGNQLVKVAARGAKSSINKSLDDRSTNIVRDSTLKQAQEAGYVVTPSVAGGNLPGRIIEGLSGKEKAAQAASVKNQPVTDRAIRRVFGLPDDAAISHETMAAVRSEAFASGYAPVRAIGVDGPRIRIKPDEEFKAAAQAITSRSDNASNAFGDLVKSDASGIVEGLKKSKPFTGAEAVDAIAILREKSSQAYKTDKTLGKAYKDAAEAIEGQVERYLTKSGKNGGATLKAFRDARRTMAQSFEVEKALREGAGSLDARVLGKIYGKNPKRLSGGLATIGRTANAFPEVMGVPKSGWGNPVTALDTLGYGSASLLTGNPLPMAIPASRAVSRAGLLTGPGQKMFSAPKRGPGNVLLGAYGLMDDPLTQRLGGLLGLSAVSQ